jgi:ATP-dependent protease HslVU (ClpYQ) peptidase subunit
MSVVVYKDGVMAGDSRAYGGDPHLIGSKRKIHRLQDGSLLGITSNQVGMSERIRDWVADGMDVNEVMPAGPCFDAILVRPNGEVFVFNDGYYPSGPLTAESFSIGSGKKYASGAIQMGAGVTEAVNAAIACDMWCGAPIHTLTLEP